MTPFTLLSEIQNHLDKGFEAYKAYMANGKIFLHAKGLRYHNGIIMERLQNHIVSLPEDQQENARALLHHISIWADLWDNLQTDLKPADMDEFVFENSVTFPQAEVAALMAYKDTLKPR